MSKTKNTPEVRRGPLAGWGRSPIVEGYEAHSEDLQASSRGSVLSRGLGRSYGDASLPPSDGRHCVANSTRANRLLAFDAERGVVRAEAGLSLVDLHRSLLPQRFFTPVSPGTQYVTVGGMVAADIHGKNHHVAGCFGEHVLGLTLALADGRTVHASDDENRELFRATLGGMGLTGHILDVEFRMEALASPWIEQEVETAPDLDSLITALERGSREWPMTVAWSDLLARGAARGRGTLIQGRWADADLAPPREPRLKSPFSIPFTAPDWLLSRYSLGPYNALRYTAGRIAPSGSIVDPFQFFYPLDLLLDWTKLYGPRGFTQYQCVLPYDGDHRRYHEMLEVFDRHDQAPYLCVIKDCGPEGRGTLSFPKRGISFALDFPVHPERTQPLIDELNELVIREGGRVYLAKDAFTRPEHFRAMEPRLDQFLAVRDEWDPNRALTSALGHRLFGDGEVRKKASAPSSRASTKNPASPALMKVAVGG